MPEASNSSLKSAHGGRAMTFQDVEESLVPMVVLEGFPKEAVFELGGSS